MVVGWGGGWICMDEWEWGLDLYGMGIGGLDGMKGGGCERGSSIGEL